MGLKQAGADLFLKDGLLNGNRWIAARSSETAEISGNNYARILMALADWMAGTAGNANRYLNSAAENFPEPSAAWANWTHWALHGHATNAAPLFLVAPLTSGGGAAQLGAVVGFQIGALRLGGTGTVTAAGALAGLREGLLSGTRYLSIHNNEPANPTSNRLDDAISVVAADWTLDNFSTTRRRARNNKILSFGVQTADIVTPVWVALSDGTGAADNVLWKDNFAGADDPMLGDTVAFAVNVLDIRVVKDAT